MKIISACLFGIKCQYNNRGSQNSKAVELLKSEVLIPVYPEQLGGLKTPRARQEIQGGKGKDVLNRKARVMNEKGEDVTGQFIKGAEETLIIANLFRVKEFIAKSNSPSCGCGKIYDGTFSAKLIDGDGVTVALLKRNGIKITLEKDL